MEYKLAPNMYWLPGYEDRYAVRLPRIDDPYAATLGINDAQVQLYSYVSPGNVGQPYPLCRTNSGRWAVTKRGAHWKTTLSDEEVIRFVKASPAYKKAQQEHLTFMIPKTQPSSPQNSSTGTGWVIGDMFADKLGFSNLPKTHPTEKEAYAEAERLATKHPGRTFIVFKAVRSVVSGGLVTTDL